MGCLLGSIGLDYIASLPLPSILLWFLLYIFTCRRSFLVVFMLFSLIAGLWLVVTLCAHRRKWAQGLSTPPSWTHTSPINMSLGIYPDEIKTYVYAENMHSNICGSFIHNYQNLDAIKMCFSRWMDKVWYNHRLGYYSSIKRNELSSYKKTGRNKCILLSERSHSEKVIYCMIPTIWLSGKEKMRDNEKISSHQGFSAGGGQWVGGMQEIFRVLTVFYMI